MKCLLVDPDIAWLEASSRVIADSADSADSETSNHTGDPIDLDPVSDFQTAREHLLKAPPQILATNLRLGPFNGLHLVYLAAAEPEIRCVVFGDRADLALIDEARRAGAFYEETSRVAYALRSYASATLPERDRRSPLTIDRRAVVRGSRRSADCAA